jgi:SSS family solute:Na+ symporter
MPGPLDIAFIAIYLGVLLAVALFGFRGREETQENLILAGRRLTLPAFVATLVSTWYGGILGVGEFSYLYGISSWLVFGVPYYLSAALFALFLVKRARQSPDMTIPDRLAKSFGLPAAIAGSIVVIIVTLPVGYVLMVGVLFHHIFNWPIWLGIVIGTFFSVIYVASGGFRAVVWTDILQFTLMFVGFIVLFVVCVASFGGFGFLAANLPQTHFTPTGGNPIDYIAFWYIVALVTLVEPSFYQRCFAAKSEKVARRGIFISILFWILFDFLTTSCGLYARAALPNLADPVASYPALAKAILPAGLLGLFLLSLLATIMSTVDSYMFLTATTFSHDLVWRLKNFPEWKIKRFTALGLAISSVLTITVAIISDSVINVWHDFGSVGTASLLIPLLTSYWGRYTYSTKGAAGAILSAGLVTTGALLYPDHMGNGQYLLGIEPIFLGLTVSLAFFVLTRKVKPSI